MAKDFTVAIVGGGMCGLACTVGLSKSGIHVDVFEAGSKFEEVGAGVGLGPNALRALKGLGLYEAVLSRSDTPSPTFRQFLFLSGLGEHEVIYDYPRTADDLGLGIYRPVFFDAVVGLLDPSTVHFNKRCVSLTTTETTIAITFADGTTHEADLVIGADGIRSVARNFVVVDAMQKHVTFTNTVAYRGLIPLEDLEAAGLQMQLSTRPIALVGLNKHFVIYPIHGDKRINVVVFMSKRDIPPQPPLPSPWVTAASDGELQDQFQEWGRDARIIVDHMKASSKWSIHALNPPLASYCRGRVVLVGDAAHGMPPHLGAGAGQGFEDVFVLCELLKNDKVTKSNLEVPVTRVVQDALQAYTEVRAPRANWVLERTIEAGQIYESYQPGRETQEVTKLSNLWDPIWHHDLGVDVNRAVEMVSKHVRVS
ncbi:FAD/NAD(P)-binding domain-containing protein [Guyanagaster necrorhizus]|uniref:FAD/NAD(P)-binding domain-containing protein n=1 Tax=Guyanagaster necrorhizus TaxID=856835 RepID=A0A9P7W3Y8_9AGAR|nr:FAD/NAD(P)-binding domain-containing protein [Guyanagaster necrorhizus MCA 3950]KAG7452203.1 FAD/NAD(P)-binding domain-containing protein [Guyanagaster necrorhizus MCA 3950]